MPKGSDAPKPALDADRSRARPRRRKARPSRRRPGSPARPIASTISTEPIPLAMAPDMQANRSPWRARKLRVSQVLDPARRDGGCDVLAVAKAAPRPFHRSRFRAGPTARISETIRKPGRARARGSADRSGPQPQWCSGKARCQFRVRGGVHCSVRFDRSAVSRNRAFPLGGEPARSLGSARVRGETENGGLE